MRRMGFDNKLVCAILRHIDLSVFHKNAKKGRLEEIKEKNQLKKGHDISWTIRNIAVKCYYFVRKLLDTHSNI